MRDSIREGLLQKNIILRRLKYLETVSSFRHDYERPVWVEKQMEEMQKEYRDTIRNINNAKKKNTIKS